MFFFFKYIQKNKILTDLNFLLFYALVNSKDLLYPAIFFLIINFAKYFLIIQHSRV